MNMYTMIFSQMRKTFTYAVIHFYIPIEDSNRWTDISSARIMSNWQVLHVVQQIVPSDSGVMTAKAAVHSKEASGENIFCGFSQAEFVSHVWV